MMQPHAIKYVTIRGFRSIAAVEKLELGTINVLIGANGSGKSNFIQAFVLIDDCLDDRPGPRTEPGDPVLHFGSSTAEDIYLRIVFEGGGSFEATLTPQTDDRLYVSSRQSDMNNFNPRSNTGPWRVYHFHDTSSSSPMRLPAKVDDVNFLRPDGANLAAFLHHLRARHDTSYSMIRRTVKLVAPFIDDFLLEPHDLESDLIRLEWRHKNSGQHFNVSSLSDGTLRFIVLATLFLQPEEYRPSLILVDEPELGLHPYAITLLASLIRMASGKTQIIVSTQSSRLLDYFDPQDVLVADRVHGGTQITRLDPAGLAIWLEDYSLGQLWEKNEFEGQPVPER
jgi:predicted ATPase